MAHRSDAEIIATTRNTARFFVENRHVAWVALVATLFWGIYGYANMPKRKDPDIPIRVASASCPWPGVRAEEVEQLVTRPIEQAIASSNKLHSPGPGNEFAIQSTTLSGLAVVRLQLADSVNDTKPFFNDVSLRLNALNASLPQGAGPIQFNGDFGDTAALMLTVASPTESRVEIGVRGHTIARAIDRVRASLPASQASARAALIVAFPRSADPRALSRMRDVIIRGLTERGDVSDVRPLDGPGFSGFDATVNVDDATYLGLAQQVARERLGVTRFHPDAWQPVVIRRPADAEARLATVAGDKYSYHDLDNFTDLISRALQSVPQVSTTQRSGVLPEQIWLEYSQEQLASYGLQPSNLKDALGARNIAGSGGSLQVGRTNLLIDPSGQFTDPQQIGGVAIAFSSDHAPVYLRDLVDISRGYQNPARFLNYYAWRDAAARWHRNRAVTLATQMHSREQINQFGAAIDAALERVKQALPEDLILARTSDQPRQVRESLSLFMEALYEAVALVVLTAWLGFWEWRSALLMALSMPLTLTMTFGMMFMLGIDLQQVSIATLIIALGLLVDDPVVAGDAIKRDLGEGHPPKVAAWLGPTKLAHAILFATLTNIVAYLPFLLLTGNTGDFLYSLPLVMTCTLVASRLVSMTFIPLLGYYLLRPETKPELSIEERRRRGFTGLYFRTGYWLIEHRRPVLLASLAFLGAGVVIGKQLPTAFFPEDVQYLSYLEVWLPNDAPLSATDAVADEAERIVRDVARKYGAAHPGEDGKPRTILRSVTSFVGGGSPRFWNSVSPQFQQPNYAQLIVEVMDKDDTPALMVPLQHALSAGVPGASVQTHQLESNPVDHPIELHISGRADVDPGGEAEDIRTLRGLAERVEAILRNAPGAGLVFDDWFDDSLVVKLKVDPDRANIAGVTNLDVANSSAAGISGTTVAVLRDGDRQIPVVARLRMEERARLSDVQNLYVYSSETQSKVPLLQVSSVGHDIETQRICRRELFRTITVIGYPLPGVLASRVLRAVQPQLDDFLKSVPPGYRVVFGGEKAKQVKGFRQLAMIMAISAALIFAALVIQFNNAIKPILVFAAVPFGVVGALAGLYTMGAPFGFMAFLGIASLVGVIVSHVIVLFDFIEQMHERGEPLVEALLDAGIQRLRPVMITVGATVLALIPLAVHGGPLWQPLCYAQIGGLSLATFIELLLVKVFYAIFVLDLKIIQWGPAGEVASNRSASASH
jgi:multidrug efflux pump